MVEYVLSTHKKGRNRKKEKKKNYKIGNPRAVKLVGKPSGTLIHCWKEYELLLPLLDLVNVKTIFTQQSHC